MGRSWTDRPGEFAKSIPGGLLDGDGLGRLLFLLFEEVVRKRHDGAHSRLGHQPRGESDHDEHRLGNAARNDLQQVLHSNRRSGAERKYKQVSINSCRMTDSLS
jgi:hypothetical protein